jgi:hypothetical protein
MFERNKIDSIQHTGVAVEIVTDADETLVGRVLVGTGRTLAQVLNGEGGFVEFEPWGEERMLLAKAALRSIRPVAGTRTESLQARAAALDGFDPYTILGVGRGASLEEIRTAWHRLSKTYHPDRYAAAELPAEVGEYLASMVRRINTAYAALETAFMSRRVPQRGAPSPAPAHAPRM